MVHAPALAVANETFVFGEVQPNAWKIALSLEGSAIPYAPLCRVSAARIRVDLERARRRRQLQARLIIDPRLDVVESLSQEVLRDVRRVHQSEIEILRESVCLEVAFLEARSSLEHPSVSGTVIL